MRSIALALIVCTLAACAGEDEYELHMTAQVKNTSRPCGPSIQYCIDSKPTTGTLTGRLVMRNPPHLFVRKGCEGDGERVGDSVFVTFASPTISGGSCYSFNVRVRIDGDRVTGRWGEGSDGHGGGVAGILEGFRN